MLYIILLPSTSYLLLSMSLLRRRKPVNIECYYQNHLFYRAVREICFPDEGKLLLPQLCSNIFLVAKSKNGEHLLQTASVSALCTVHEVKPGIFSVS